MYYCTLATAGVTFKKIWLEHNVTQNGEMGMKVHVSFDISGMKGQKCSAIAYFDHPKGSGVRDTNGRYCTTSGTVCTSTEFVPNWPTTIYHDLTLFIPNNELHLLSGKRTYYARVFIQAPNGNFLGNTDFVSFDGTGSDNNSANNYQQNNSRSSNQKWREDLDYGMFAINEGDPNGVRHRTIYRACVACKGTVLCGSCHGMGLCILCNGKGGMVTAGYGTYLSCVSCGQTGRCSLCRGTGKCNCANTEYPGYMPGSTLVLGANGQVIYNTGNYDSGSSSSSSSSSSGTCPKCVGRRFESQRYQYSADSRSYLNVSGSDCPYCGYKDKHYHYPCTGCNGTGHN